MGLPIAKAIVKTWLKDHDILSETLPDLLDMLKDRATSERDLREAAEQLTQIGVQIVQQMQPVFDETTRRFPKNTCTALAHELAATLAAAQIDARLLMTCNLDPVQRSRQLRQLRLNALKMLAPDAVGIYYRLLEAAAHVIVEQRRRGLVVLRVADERQRTTTELPVRQRERLRTCSDPTR